MQKNQEQDETSELIQRIIELERDQAAKVQENRLLMLKFKNIDSGKAIGGKRFDLASIDASVYQSKPEERRGPKLATGSITGRSNSSVGRLDPINKATAQTFATIEPSTISKSALGKVQKKNIQIQNRVKGS